MRSQAERSQNSFIFPSLMFPGMKDPPTIRDLHIVKQDKRRVDELKTRTLERSHKSRVPSSPRVPKASSRIYLKPHAERYDPYKPRDGTQNQRSPLSSSSKQEQDMDRYIRYYLSYLLPSVKLQEDDIQWITNWVLKDHTYADKATPKSRLLALQHMALQSQSYSSMEQLQAALPWAVRSTLSTLRKFTPPLESLYPPNHKNGPSSPITVVSNSYSMPTNFYTPISTKYGVRNSPKYASPRTHAPLNSTQPLLSPRNPCPQLPSLPDPPFAPAFAQMVEAASPQQSETGRKVIKPKVSMVKEGLQRNSSERDDEENVLAWIKTDECHLFSPTVNRSTISQQDVARLFGWSNCGSHTLRYLKLLNTYVEDDPKRQVTLLDDLVDALSQMHIDSGELRQHVSRELSQFPLKFRASPPMTPEWIETVLQKTNADKALVHYLRFFREHVPQFDSYDDFLCLINQHHQHILKLQGQCLRLLQKRSSAGLLSIRNALERTIAQEESLQERLNTTLPANNDEARPTDILDSLLFGMDPCNLAGSIHPDTVTLSHVEALFRANNFSPWVVPKLETLQFLQMKFNSFPALIEAVGRVEPNLDLVSPKFFAAFPFLSSPPSANMETSSPAQLNETEMFKANNVLAAKSLTSEEFKGKVDIQDGQQLAFYLSYLHDHDAQRSTVSELVGSVKACHSVFCVQHQQIMEFFSKSSCSPLFADKFQPANDKERTQFCPLGAADIIDLLRHVWRYETKSAAVTKNAPFCPFFSLRNRLQLLLDLGASFSNMMDLLRAVVSVDLLRKDLLSRLQFDPTAATSDGVPLVYPGVVQEIEDVDTLLLLSETGSVTASYLQHLQQKPPKDAPLDLKELSQVLREIHAACKDLESTKKVQADLGW